MNEKPKSAGPTRAQIEAAQKFGRLCEDLKKFARRKTAAHFEQVDAMAMTALLRTAWEVAREHGPQWEALFMRTVAGLSGAIVNEVTEEMLANDGPTGNDAGPVEADNGSDAGGEGGSRH